MRLLRALRTAVIYPVVLAAGTAVVAVVLALAGGAVVAAVLVDFVVSMGLILAAAVGFLVGLVRG